MLSRLLIILVFLVCFLAHGDQGLEADPSLTPRTSQATADDESEDPLIPATDIIKQRAKKTIGASVKNLDSDYGSTGESDPLESFQAALGGGEDLSETEKPESSQQRLQAIAIAFLVEFLVTLLILAVAFQLSGLHRVFRQTLCLSLAVALLGALLDTLFVVSPLNPIRSLAGFIILTALIRQFTEVPAWATAIKIALVARLASLAIIWLIAMGLSALLSL